MALLPEEQRTAIILKEHHGLTFQEIADLLDCPSTVNTALSGLTVRRHLEQADVDRAERARARSGALEPVIDPRTCLIEDNHQET
jgi:hypothetical protein